MFIEKIPFVRFFLLKLKGKKHNTFRLHFVMDECAMQPTFNFYHNQGHFIIQVTCVKFISFEYLAGEFSTDCFQQYFERFASIRKRCLDVHLHLVQSPNDVKASYSKSRIKGLHIVQVGLCYNIENKGIVGVVDVFLKNFEGVSAYFST